MTKLESSSKPVSVLIYPTWTCNLHCLYCYSGKSNYSGKMSIETLKNSLYKIADYNEKFGYSKLIWHGGEATLMGTIFFQKAVEIQNEFQGKHKFINSLQTNGTRLSESLMDFFIENKFGIGISLDGDSELHDSQRVNQNGKGTHKKVESSIQYLKSHGNSVNTLAVMTSNTLKDLDLFYNFIRNQGNSVKINPLILTGYADENKDLGITPQQYGEAITYLFDKWLEEPEFTFSIEPIAEMLHAIVTGNPKTCAFSKNCADAFIGIDYQGNITTCGKWIETEYVYGNINSISIADALQSSQAKKFIQNLENVLNNCSACKYVSICNSGCPHNTYTVRKEITDKDFYCQAYQIIFNHIESKLHKEIQYV